MLEAEIAKHKNLKLLGKADTNWTQEGSFKAMSGFLAQYGNVDAVLFEYADGFRGGLRAYDAAKKAPDLIVSLRTDEMGVICDWEKANDPNFKIFYSNGQNDQARFCADRGDDEEGRQGRSAQRQCAVQDASGRQGPVQSGHS